MRRGAIAVAVAVAGLAWGASDAAAADPVLGSPTYVGDFGTGWGTVAPAVLSNGGVPSGTLGDIRWSGWGSPTATGSATAALYLPEGGYYRTRTRVPVKATNLATCPGSDTPAYTELWLRLPQWPGGPLGSWFKWSASKTICDFDERDPVYSKARSPGHCGSIGATLEPGTVQSISTYRMSCSRARSAARVIRSTARYWSPPKCSTAAGCRSRVRGLHCAVSLHRDDNSGAAERIQRVACRRGQSTFTAWHIIPYGD